MVYQENLSEWKAPAFQQEKSTWEKIFGAIGSVRLEPEAEMATDRSLQFEQYLEKNLEPNLSIEDMSVRMVQSALEVEFGAKALYDLDYAKMIGVIASALRNTPEMREVMLGVANRILRRKLNLTKRTVH